jgi:hypothetical protein
MVICVNAHATRQNMTIAQAVNLTGTMKAVNANAHLLLMAIRVLTQVRIQIGMMIIAAVNATRLF